MSRALHLIHLASRPWKEPLWQASIPGIYRIPIHIAFVTTHSPTLPSLYLRHSSLSKPSVALPTSQFILQPFFRFSYATSSSLNSPGEPPMRSIPTKKAIGNGNATVTVLSLSEQMGLNVFVQTKETKRKRQRNRQTTKNLQLLQSRHAVNQLPVSVFSTCFSIPPNPILQELDKK